MKQCKCGSYALNLHKEGIDQGNLCDRHYWQDRAEKSEKDAARYRWLTKHAYVGECFTEHGPIFDVQNSDREVPIYAPLDEAIDAAIAKDAP